MLCEPFPRGRLYLEKASVPLSQNNIHPCCHKCFGALVARSRKDSVTGSPTSGAIAFMVDMPEDGAEIKAASPERK
jgi:hypothetical protein